MLGFVSDMPSGFRMLEDQQIKDIIEQIDFKINKVLLTSKVDLQEIIDQVIFTKADTVQIVDYVSPGVHKALKQALPDLKTIQVVHVEDEGALDESLQYNSIADYVLLDSGTPKSDSNKKILGGTGKTHNWEVSKQIVSEMDIPIILAGGLNPENIKAAINTVGPAGVDVCSGLRDPKYLIEEKLASYQNTLKSVIN